MRKPSHAAALAALIAACFLTPAANSAPPETVASTEARSPEEELKAFRLPEGFVAELVAAEPEIQKPLNIAFDDQGRLWVTDTVEYPYPVAPGTPGRDTVKVLSDFGPDGRARKIVTFADGLNIPIGLLPMPGGRKALVHSIPTVSLMEDTDGDGKADRREPAYQTYGFRDTHGMTNAFTWGFDGWVYATHGFSNESKVAGADGNAITMQSGNTYRMRPDGSHAEYFTHGQVNPFGLAFDPLGNLYSSDCHTKPIYQLLRGAWYPSFGKPHDGLGFGPEMCAHDHGSTGIAGIVYYAADHFPAEHRGSVYVGNVVTSRINRDNIAWTGSSPKAVEQPDLVASDDPWFRPVDLKVGPDGALYVADFYNRIIGHYEVPLTHPGRDRERGRIWRIVYKGKGGNGRPQSPREDWSKATADELISDLGHPNLSVRTFAANALATRGTPDAGLVKKVATLAAVDPEPNRRVHALWVLERWGALDPATLCAVLADADRTVRAHAQRVLAERPSLDPSLTDRATQALDDPDPFVRRAAAEVLGRHPAIEHVRPLLALRQGTDPADNHLVHVVRMALRDQFVEGDAWEKLGQIKLSDRDAADIADVATGVPGAGSARFLLGHVQTRKESPENLRRYVQHVARYIDESRRGELLDVVRGVSGPNRLAVLKAVQLGTQERGASVDEATRAFALGETLALLGRPDDAGRASGIDLASAFKLREAKGRLAELAGLDSVPTPQRVEAMAAVAAVDPAGATAVVGPLLVDPNAPFPVRERAAGLLAQSGRPEGVRALAEALPTAPERVQSAIAAGLAGRREGAELLLAAVGEGKASARLLQEPRVAGPLGNAGVPGLAGRLESLLKGLPPADARTNDLINRRRAGYRLASLNDSRETGRKLFETHCAACHQIGGEGAKVGPQLDGIGGRGPDRLMEDILDPGRNVDQAFRVTNLALADGRVVSGLLLREEGAVLVMADAQGKEVRVPADQVEERSVVPLSPMPANFAEQVSEDDFYRLIGFLMSRTAPQ